MKIKAYANHDPDDPMEHLDAIEAANLSLSLPKCPHCHETRTMIPMPGPGWAVGHIHEPDCPLHEGNRPTLLIDTETMNRLNLSEPRTDDNEG